MVRAEAFVGQTRNTVPVSPPINVLPPDLLIYIFQLVLQTQPCVFESKKNRNNFHDHPITLSHVCSSWRQIVLGLSNFWSHIDLSLTPSSLLVCARAECFVARAGHSPLDLHIKFDLDRNKSEYPEADALNLCTRAAPRIRSLQLSRPRNSVTFSRLQSVLQSCFVDSTPGTLTKLKLYTDVDLFIFIKSAENPVHPPSYVLNLPHIEDVLLGVTSLQLNGIYPYWTSKAYHGLVELRLLGQDTGAHIYESQLVHMLASSPQLRIFVLHLTIMNQLPDETLPTPIKLESLEVLDMSSMYYYRSKNVLRWLAPGPNPVHVSPGVFLMIDPPWIGGVLTSFNARSNISRLDLEGASQNLPLSSLLAWLPKLRVLSLLGFSLVGGIEESPDADGQLTCRLPKLDTMHIAQCDVSKKGLRQIAKIHSIHTITVSGGWLYLQSGGGRLTMTEGLFEEHLSGIAPVAEFRSPKSF